MEPDAVIAYIPIAIKSISDKSAPNDPGRYFSGMLNACTVDMEDEVFDPKGIDTKAFMSAGGPILAGSHFSESTGSGESTVVARVLSLSKRDDGLYINKAEFDTDPLAEHYKGKVQRGFIKGMSAALRRVECKYESKGGRQIRNVQRSVLIHGLLTAQPVNRESLIGRKSLERIEVLARELESLRASSVSNERLQELADSIKSMSEQLQELSVSLQADRTSDAAPSDPLGAVAQAVATMAVEAYKAANPGLSAEAFIAEKCATPITGGLVHRKYLHLPHHAPSVKSGTEHESVNKSLLRSALALAGSVRPVGDDADLFRRRVLNHLRAHAGALGMDKE